MKIFPHINVLYLLPYDSSPSPALHGLSCAAAIRPGDNLKATVSFLGAEKSNLLLTFEVGVELAI